MPNAVLTLLVCLGAALCVSGVICIVARRRLARGLEGAVQRGPFAGRPVVHAMVIGVLQIVLGPLLISVAFVRRERDEADDFARVAVYLVQRVGLDVILVGWVAVACAILALVAAFLLGRRVVSRLRSWDSTSGGSLPAPEARRIVAGTVLLILGIVSGTLGLILLTTGSGS